MRLRGNGYSNDDPGYTEIPCDGGGGPDEFQCTVSTNGNDAVLSFAGPRGEREQLRSVESGWVATVTGQASVTVSGGAGESYLVRLRGNGYSNDDPGYTQVDCA